MTQSTFPVRKAAVLGAGVMGAQIAAHFVNAGIPVLLFDLPAKDGDPCRNRGQGDRQPGEDRARAARGQGSRLRDRGVPLLAPISRGLGECDLVVEAIGERLDWKRDLYAKIAPHVASHAVLASNTSGLSLATLASSLPDGRSRALLRRALLQTRRATCTSSS
jgi:3-hydroxyacyl-CoA dehydrogenase